MKILKFLKNKTPTIMLLGRQNQDQKLVDPVVPKIKLKAQRIMSGIMKV
jgi:hypothetical protein